MPYRNKYRIAMLLGLFGLLSCRTASNTSSVAQKEIVATVSRDSTVYELYRLPVAKMKGSQNEIKFSMRIINKKGGASPLRNLCSDINEYNIYYEYLLNHAQNDIVLTDKDRLYYPVAYSFENSYNAFPFETINVSYRLMEKHRKIKEYNLVYIDKVFSKDTVSFRFKN